MTISFIHTADWQIGKQFANIKEDIAAFLREARFDVIKTLARLANEHAVAAVLVAGDVFDANEVSDTTLRKTLNAMQAFQGPWVLLPGNHDPALAQSVWTRMNHLPEKTANILFALQPEPIILADGQLHILPAPLKLRHEFKDLTAWYDSYQSPASAFRVGLAHGSVEGFLPESAEIHNMIAYQRETMANLDYLALGDWHGQLKVSAKTWYAGTPEQDRFQDNEPGKALLVTLNKANREPTVTSLPTGKYQWQRADFNVFNETDIAALDDYCQQLTPTETQVVSLQLTGNLSLENRQRLNTLLETWQARFARLVWNDTKLELSPSAEDLQDFKTTGILNEMLTQLLTIKNNPEHEQHAYADRAIQMLWQALQSDKRAE